MPSLLRANVDKHESRLACFGQGMQVVHTSAVNSRYGRAISNVSGLERKLDQDAGHVRDLSSVSAVFHYGQMNEER